MLGILFAITASVCFGATAIFARLGLRHIKPSAGTFISVISSLIVVGLLALITNFDAIVSLSLTAVLWFGMIGIIQFVIARQSNFLATRHIGVAKASPMLGSGPLFAMVIAVAFTGETVNISIVTGTVCIVAGLSLLVTGE